VQIGFLFLYAACFCCSIMDLSFMLLAAHERRALHKHGKLPSSTSLSSAEAEAAPPDEGDATGGYEHWRDAWDLINVILVCATVLILSSVMHRLPTRPPFDMLVYLLRTIMVLYFCRFAFSWWLSWRWWQYVEVVAYVVVANATTTTTSAA